MSGWSSDVCSSDLGWLDHEGGAERREAARPLADQRREPCPLWGRGEEGPLSGRLPALAGRRKSEVGLCQQEGAVPRLRIDLVSDGENLLPRRIEGVEISGFQLSRFRSQLAERARLHEEGDLQRAVVDPEADEISPGVVASAQIRECEGPCRPRARGRMWTGPGRR